MSEGLVIFVTVWVLNGIGLAVDAYLYLNDKPTISSVVRMHHAVGLPIIGLQIVGLFGLVSHFLWWKP